MYAKTELTYLKIILKLGFEQIRWKIRFDEKFKVLL